MRRPFDGVRAAPSAERRGPVTNLESPAPAAPPDNLLSLLEDYVRRRHFERTLTFQDHPRDNVWRPLVKRWYRHLRRSGMSDDAARAGAPGGGRRAGASGATGGCWWPGGAARLAPRRMPRGLLKRKHARSKRYATDDNPQSLLPNVSPPSWMPVDEDDLQHFRYRPEDRAIRQHLEVTPLPTTAHLMQSYLEVLFARAAADARRPPTPRTCCGCCATWRRANTFRRSTISRSSRPWTPRPPTPRAHVRSRGATDAGSLRREVGWHLNALTQPERMVLCSLLRRMRPHVLAQLRGNERSMGHLLAVCARLRPSAPTFERLIDAWNAETAAPGLQM